MPSTPLSPSPAAPRRRERDNSGWGVFFSSLGALGAALLLALYSRVAAEGGRVWLASLTALSALAIAGWVAVKLVPALARRSRLRWLALRLDYRVTRDGLLFFAAIIVLALAALNTGNNLLFIIVACMLASILISGILSHLVLSGIELRLDLPEHIFAGQSARGLAQLTNAKRRLPSFSLRLWSPPLKSNPETPSAGRILEQPVYFPHLPARLTCRQNLELQFPRRGVYREQVLALTTRFPFGFVEKTRRMDSALEAVVYPAIEPVEHICEDWALVSGEMESHTRGRGNDLYAIRAYQNSDSVRHVDWKASAKRNALQVREFTREDQRQVLLVLDVVDPAPTGGHSSEASEKSFERAVSVCAGLAWHFYESDSVLGFRTDGCETPPAPAAEVIYDILKQLALAAPHPAEPGSPPAPGTAGSSEVFKIVVTRRPRGTIPSNLWSSSFIVFVE